MSSEVSIHPRSTTASSRAPTLLPAAPSSAIARNDGRGQDRCASAHNHACGCTRCWKPEGALFSVVAVVPRDKLSVTENEDKLKVVDDKRDDPAPRLHRLRRAHVRPHREQGTRSTAWISSTPSCRRTGWSAPEFAAFVSSIIESGADPAEHGRRARALEGTRPGALRLPVAAADGFHRDAHGAGVGRAEVLTCSASNRARLLRRLPGSLGPPLQALDCDDALRHLPAAAGCSRACPVLYWLSGLTCSEQNFITRPARQRMPPSTA